GHTSARRDVTISTNSACGTTHSGHSDCERSRSSLTESVVDDSTRSAAPSAATMSFSSPMVASNAGLVTSGTARRYRGASGATGARDVDRTRDDPRGRGALQDLPMPVDGNAHEQ